jgi:hypothetical protein
MWYVDMQMQKALPNSKPTTNSHHISHNTQRGTEQQGLWIHAAGIRYYVGVLSATQTPVNTRIPAHCVERRGEGAALYAMSTWPSHISPYQPLKHLHTPVL